MIILIFSGLKIFKQSDKKEKEMKVHDTNAKNGIRKNF